MRPNASVARCSAAWIASLLVTSQPTASAVPPSASIDATVSRPCSSVRSAATTLASSRANAIAVARPMPLPAPVTKATLPAKRPFGFEVMVWSSRGWCGPSDGEERFDGAAFVHGLVALGGLLEGQFEAEDLAGVDLPVPDQVDELGQEPAHRGRPHPHPRWFWTRRAFASYANILTTGILSEQLTKPRPLEAAMSAVDDFWQRSTPVWSRNYRPSTTVTHNRDWRCGPPRTR